MLTETPSVYYIPKAVPVVYISWQKGPTGRILKDSPYGYEFCAGLESKYTWTQRRKTIRGSFLVSI